MKLFDPPCRNTEICPPWKSCLECECRVCVSSTDALVVHLVHFGTLYVWYTGWYTKCAGHFVGTPSSFWHTRIILGHFGYDWYIVTFGTAVAFWYTEDRINVYYTSEFWYVWFTLAHLTFGTPAGTLHQLVH